MAQLVMTRGVLHNPMSYRVHKYATPIETISVVQKGQRKNLDNLEQTDITSSDFEQIVNQMRAIADTTHWTKVNNHTELPNLEWLRQDYNAYITLLYRAQKAKQPAPPQTFRYHDFDPYWK